MIATQQLYEDSINKIFLFDFNETIEEKLHKYEQPNLCRYHREKHQHHRYEKIRKIKSNNNIYKKYVATQQEYDNITLYVYFISITCCILSVYIVKKRNSSERHYELAFYAPLCTCRKKTLILIPYCKYGDNKQQQQQQQRQQ
ncbi:unnamed protein product [Rotaria socialis]|uniref:Uncharacterized protein n=1 Tax=Rotaria socialis TaxID=392032 RepID=A0A820E9N7_9BILA|nr:unnamed protein product [Rotaria socialis]CAF3329337.1 unnamed protein product [Rotaria socialis]CAF3373845.1 unnamed protein product [Rotaria socialis]CAF3448780.1 unnamed protein product [Rotaria socialis]CAF4109692.1 unnamed protein product [Rotaria socialis]